MNIKKISAAVIAAAVLAVAAPMTGVLPEPLSVVASAASPDPMQTEYKAGDVFYAGIDSDGAFNGNCISSKEMAEDYSNLNAVDAYRCTVKSDGTIKIAYELLPAVYYKLYGKTLTVPNEIGGYTVSEIENNDHNFAESGCKKIIIPDTVKTIGQTELVGGILCLNCGSITLPKENTPHCYMVYENSVFVWKQLDGGEYMRYKVNRNLL